MFSIPLIPCPNRLAGLRLNRTLRRDWASGERNWGIPSLALRGEGGRGVGGRGGGGRGEGVVEEKGVMI